MVIFQALPKNWLSNITSKRGICVRIEMERKRRNENKSHPLKCTAKKTKSSTSEDHTQDSDDITVNPVELANARLGTDFFHKDCEALSKALLGKKLVRLTETGERLSGMIVETEAYCGTIDQAAHSYNGKKTEKTTAMFMDPGTAYVYHIYGMYCCMNISSEGEGAAVLLRSLEPLEGLNTMEKARNKKLIQKKMKSKDLCNGPSKLCQALQISKDAVNKQDLTTNKHIWLESYKEIRNQDIVISKRINIGYAGDWVEKPLRFYVNANSCVSVRDKEAEKKIEEANEHS